MSAQLAVAENNVLVHPASSSAMMDAQSFMPVLEIDDILKRQAALSQFKDRVLTEGRDFGVIPGTGDKPTLLKPGAEKLCTLFGLTVKPNLVEKIEDWSGKDHDGEPFFYYWYRMELYRGAQLVAAADGSCNSRESKYRWRKSERVCPSCGKAAIIKGKAEFGGGWLCFKKKDGCNAKFAEKDPAIISQEVGRVPNPDIADQINTIQKMALKRALVGATLIGINASDFFTQDVEDLPQDDAPGNGQVYDGGGSDSNAMSTPEPAKTAPRSTAPQNHNEVARLRSEFNSLHSQADNCDVPRLSLPVSADTPEKIQSWIDGYKKKIAAAQPPIEPAADDASGMYSEESDGKDEIPEAELVDEKTEAAPPNAGLIFDIPVGTPKANCASCNAEIFWITTAAGKKMPANGDGTSHFATCPNADQHRKPSAPPPTDAPSTSPADGPSYLDAPKNAHLKALFAAANAAGLDTKDGEKMRQAINGFFANTQFPVIKSRSEITKGFADGIIENIRTGHLKW